MQTKQFQAVQSAVQILGNQTVLARALGVTPATVGQWLRPDVRTGREVPPKQCVRIEQLTKGAVSRRDLRPNDWAEYWPELAQAPASPAQEATETVAVMPVNTPATAALRAGAVRRLAKRRADEAAAERDRRAKGGPPFQGVDVGVA